MIPISKYSRPGSKLKEIMAIVIHWPDWAGKSAQDIYDYFAAIENEKRYASVQYVVGLEGEIVQCIPEDEMAYHCGSVGVDPVSKRVYTDKARSVFGEYARDPLRSSPNQVTIGIEVCHTDANGNMNYVTVQSLVKFVSELCVKYGLDPKKQVLRHYDVVGWKSCPKYWCDNVESWNQFLTEVEEWKA